MFSSTNVIFSVIGVIFSSLLEQGNMWEESRFSNRRIGAVVRTCHSPEDGSLCQQKCINTLNGPVCSCWHGFRIASDASSCLDINECSSGIVRCQQICKNTFGSYKCVCRPDYRMQANGKTCIPIPRRHGMSESLRSGRHAVNSRSDRLQWYHQRKTISNQDYDDAYEEREYDSDDGAEDVNNPYFSGRIRNPHYWRRRNNRKEAGTGINGNLLYSNSPCQPCHQICYWSSSSDEVKCGCWHGYTIAEGSDVGCTDVDECSLHHNLCQNGVCINTIGSFICRCRPGFLFVRNACVDINECAGIAGSRLCDHICINTPGSYHCTCHAGYIISVNNAGTRPSSECVDIDECSLGSCSHLCSNYPGGFLCSCPDRMELHDDGRTCIFSPHHSIENDPDVNKHSEEEDNRDESGNHSPKFFFSVTEDVIEWNSHVDKVGQSKLKANETLGRSCSTVCLNGGKCMNGKCHCPVGITGIFCQKDVNECLSSSPDCSHNCINTFGSYLCMCPPGYHLNSDGRTCSTLSCSPFCMNGGSCDSGKCICPHGFTGVACDSDVNECMRNPSLCGGGLCINSYGGYDCICPPNQKTWINEDGVQNPCLSDFSFLHSAKDSVSVFKQPYEYSHNERTHHKSNISPLNNFPTSNHTLPPAEDDDKKLKVLIEILVSTVSSDCNTSSSVYAPIFIAASDKQVTVNSNWIPNATTVDNAEKGLLYPQSVVSSIDILPSHSSTPTINESVIAKKYSKQGEFDENIASTILSIRTSGVVVSSTSTMKNLTPPYNITLEDVSSVTTPALYLNSNYTLRNLSVINSEPLGKRKNLSFDLIPSTVEKIDDSNASERQNAPNSIPNAMSESLHSNIPQLSPGTLEGVFGLSSEPFSADVPQNQTSKLIHMTEEVGVISENKMHTDQENYLLVNTTEREKILMKSSSFDDSLFKMNEKSHSSLNVMYSNGSKEENSRVDGKLDSLESPASNIEIIGESFNKTANPKESRKTGNKNEKQVGKRHKSKKSRNNKWKGRKVLKLSEEFKALSQVIDLDENKHIDQLQEMKGSEKAISEGKYYDILDYGDDDDIQSNSGKTVNVNDQKISKSLALPTPSTFSISLPQLGVMWREKPGESELECHYGDRKFPSRSTFYRDERNCTQCVCKDGELRCAPRHCPPLHCESPIVDDCCSHCPGDCLFEQQVYLPGEKFASQFDPCRECRCEKGGRAVCEDIKCPPLSCSQEFRALMPGECCPACLPPEPGCFHRGRFFYLGQLWIRQEGGCHACLCKKDGEVHCNPVVCVVDCQHPQFVAGECCPVCDGCQYHNKKYNDQQLFPHPTDECSLCQCQHGNITCFPKPCPANCSHPLKLTKDHCCPRCKDCLFDGQQIRNGSSIIITSQDTCKECLCLLGDVTCKESNCSAECVLENKTWPSGSELSLGHDPCTHCHCLDGAITCKAIACPPASCSHGVLLPGSCCLHCEQCDFKGIIYHHQEVFQSGKDNCLKCSCNKGNVVCEDLCLEEDKP